jgi:hypothetical protein
MLPLINVNLSGHDVQLGEFLRFIGVLMIIANHPGTVKRDFWSAVQPTIYQCHPQLSGTISRNRFEDIVKCLKFDNTDSSGTDRFHPVRRLIEAWNRNMADNYSPGHLVCVDESMVVWAGDSAPGWMVVSRKPHPIGNEYHTIACATTKIIFHAELVEGKDRPATMPSPLFSELGKTTGSKPPNILSIIFTF